MTVLVVDDDESIRRLLVHVLTLEGFLVQTAANGAEALQHVRTTSELFELIVLDLNMPVMGGHEFHRVLQQDHPGHPPTLILSANSADAARRALGATASMSKPFDLGAFTALVRSLARRPDAELA